MTRYLSVLGLGFGDCGKGRFVDALCRQTGVHTVVRFNGGAQAGHNVVLDDGRHHTFSQFAAGSFDPQVHSVLSQAVVVHPSALLVEAQVLAGQGVAAPLQRLWIDARCRVTTPYHQAAGRLREWVRGAQAHGTCGVGVGETVAQSLRDPAAALRYGDLRSRTVALEKLEALRTALCVQLEPWLASAGPQDAAAAQEAAVLR
ncbi:adenylosuccinate synthetase, partial [Xanthomonas sp. Kuri4-1]